MPEEEIIEIYPDIIRDPLPPQEQYILLTKNDNIGGIFFKSNEERSVVCIVDSRKNEVKYKVLENPNDGLDFYNRSIESSVTNGWKITYNGERNYG